MEPSRSVEFRSDGDETALRLSYRPESGDWAVLVAEVEAPNLALTHSVESLGGDGLAGFFVSLVQDWRGWKAVRHWESLDGLLSIDAEHKGSRVELLFGIRRDGTEEAWEVRVPVVVAPGESLSRLAKDVARLFSA